MTETYPRIDVYTDVSDEWRWCMDADVTDGRVTPLDRSYPSPYFWRAAQRGLAAGRREGVVRTRGRRYMWVLRDGLEDIARDLGREYATRYCCPADLSAQWADRPTTADVIAELEARSGRQVEVDEADALLDLVAEGWDSEYVAMCVYPDGEGWTVARPDAGYGYWVPAPSDVERWAVAPGDIPGRYHVARREDAVRLARHLFLEGDE
jgi:hypothetical protein